MPNDPKNTLYFQSGEIKACGHCQPDKDFDLPEKYGVKCECKCHNYDPLIEEYVEKFEKEVLSPKWESVELSGGVKTRLGFDVYITGKDGSGYSRDSESLLQYLRTSLKEYGDKRVEEYKEKMFKKFKKALEKGGKIRDYNSEFRPNANEEILSLITQKQ